MPKQQQLQIVNLVICDPQLRTLVCVCMEKFPLLSFSLWMDGEGGRFHLNFGHEREKREGKGNHRYFCGDENSCATKIQTQKRKDAKKEIFVPFEVVKIFRAKYALGSII